jgi:hypothetical protein
VPDQDRRARHQRSVPEEPLPHASRAR